MTKKMAMFRLAMVLGLVTISAAAQLNSNPLPPVGPEKPKQDFTQPAAPTAQVASDNPFPPLNPKLFTVSEPSRTTVESYLKAMWGYDSARLWSVVAIEKTPAAGVSKVTVLVSSRNGGGVQRVVFFVLPDQKHLIADGVLPFGAQPFAELHKLMQEHANGPARGAAGKDLLLVEFADLQCARCKEAQATVDQLAKDFPQARVVFENVPVDGRPFAYQAAAYGVCVAQRNNDAFFTYEQAVYDSQDALTATGAEDALKAAVSKAGQDPAAVATCAGTQATKDSVSEAVRLGQEAGVDQTPMLFINGRAVALGAASYEMLKNIVIHQAQMDGVQLPMPAPRLNTLK